MSSKRALRRRRCSKKKRFDSQAEAHCALERTLHYNQTVGLRSLTPDNDDLETYHCPSCGGWHLGHYTKPQ